MKKLLKLSRNILIAIFSLIIIATVINVTVENLSDKKEPTTNLQVSENNIKKPLDGNQQKKVITPDSLYLNINNVRSTKNLPTFSRNPSLDKSAEMKCNDMVLNHYYDHVNPSTGKPGGKYAEDAGVKYTYVSENLNKGTFNTSSDVIDSWMGSESHKASILDPKYTEIGFATCVDGKYPNDLLIVQHKIEPYIEPIQQTYSSQPRLEYTKYSPPKKTFCTTTDSSWYSSSEYSTTCTSY